VQEKSLESGSKMRISDLNNSVDEQESLDKSDLKHVVSTQEGAEPEQFKKDKVDSLLKAFMKGRANSKVAFKKVGDRKYK